MKVYKTAKKRNVRSSSTALTSAPQQRSWKKMSMYVAAFVVVLFGVKLLLTPVVKTLAAVWEESTTAISFMLPGGPEIAEDEFGHTNVLLVGIDKRSYQPYEYTTYDGTVARNGFLADTIILASIDREGGLVNMVSLPRDLWVQVPAFGELGPQYTKINATHSLGDQFNYENNGGIGLLKATVEGVLGLPIHYWARVDFEAVVQGVDAVGGVDIYVERAFTDYNYPRSGYEDAVWEQRYEVLSFEEGWQRMDGETALKYSRSRYSLGPEGSDFARAQRQQNVITAVAHKILSSETLLSLDKLRGVYNTVSDNLLTNIGVGEFPLFYKIAKDFDQVTFNNYVVGSFDNDPALVYSPDPNQFGGAYVLIPVAGQNNYTEIHSWVKEIMDPTPTPTPLPGETVIE